MYCHEIWTQCTRINCLPSNIIVVLVDALLLPVREGIVTSPVEFYVKQIEHFCHILNRVFIVGRVVETNWGLKLLKFNSTVLSLTLWLLETKSGNSKHSQKRKRIGWLWSAHFHQSFKSLKWSIRQKMVGCCFLAHLKCSDFDFLPSRDNVDASELNETHDNVIGHPPKATMRFKTEKMILQHENATLPIANATQDKLFR